MTCAVCRCEVLPREHYFFQGVGAASRKPGQRPVREWTIWAPLYFAADPTFMKMVAAFCGAICATAWQGWKP